MGKRYFIPNKPVTGDEARRLIERSDARPLAGGRIAFSEIEVITREGHRSRSTPTELADDPDGVRVLDLLSRPRPTICGMDMSRPNIMGILNVTPDSFSDGGELVDVKDALARASAMAFSGADVWDVGGESTRPRSDLVKESEELERVLPVIKSLSAHGALPISIDSRKPNVFEAAIDAGAAMINDVSALTFDDRSLSVAAQSDYPVLLMHAQGDPETMQVEPVYDHVSLDVFDFLEERIAACEKAGIDRDRLLVDPGIGFGKTLDHNLQLLRDIRLFHGLGCPIVLGTSRKSFIAKLGSGEPADQRLGGSIATVLDAARQGVQVFRVHDVLETRQALSVWEAMTFG